MDTKGTAACTRRKLAVVGASYLQAPLILRAGEMGLETHVFAWAAGDVGESLADHFYPISIVEKEEILKTCLGIGVDGICTIASDLAAVTVGYVAEKMGLAGNSPECILRSTNKHLMRRAFQENGDPSPQSILVESPEDLQDKKLVYPVIVKPLDRSGSRGITKLENPEGLAEAIEYAKSQGFEKKALVEEFAAGQEYSVECLSWQGKHRMLAVTEKFTTGAPHFIETAHQEPAGISPETEENIRRVVFHALDSLRVTCGASHSELKIAPDGNIRLIEIGARMGGDFIGSDLVSLSTGADFVGDVIRCALGEEPEEFRAEPKSVSSRRCAAVRFVFAPGDLETLVRLKAEHPEFLIREEVQTLTEVPVTDSSTRFGYFLMAAPAEEDLVPYLPEQR